MVVVQAQGQRRLRVRVSTGSDQSIIHDGVSLNTDDKPTKNEKDDACCGEKGQQMHVDEDTVAPASPLLMNREPEDSVATPTGCLLGEDTGMPRPISYQNNSSIGDDHVSVHSDSSGEDMDLGTATYGAALQQWHNGNFSVLPSAAAQIGSQQTII